MNELFEELIGLTPNIDKRTHYLMEASHRMSAEMLKKQGKCLCVRCGKDLEEERRMCESCSDCQQCFHPNVRCLCSNEDFKYHLKNIIKEQKREDEERIKSNGWKIIEY